MEKIIIFGVPSGGLFGLHQIRKQWPKSIIYVIAFTSEIGRYSNQFDKIYFAHSSEDLRSKALKAYVEIGKGEVFAFIFANRMLEYLMNGNEELFNIFHFENSYDTFNKIVDKTAAEQLCRKLGITRPKEYNLTDPVSINSINYPVVVKPLEKYTAKGADKCRFIDNRIQLDLYLAQMKEKKIALSNLVCQKKIQGDNRWEYGYGGYFKDGKPLVDICFHQFIQEPQGLSCYAREVTDSIITEKIKQLISPFVQNLNYNGFIEFDIKQDCTSHVFFVLDINPRPWGSSDMLRIKLGNSTVYNPTLTKDKVVWRKPIEELTSSHNSNNPSYSDCKKITGTDGFKTIIGLFYKFDQKPFWKTTKEVVFNAIKHNKKRFL